eukprot:6799610-Pyramimonas_sp.AAC.1
MSREQVKSDDTMSRHTVRPGRLVMWRGDRRSDSLQLSPSDSSQSASVADLLAGTIHPHDPAATEAQSPSS